MAFHDESQVYRLFFFEKVHISADASVEFQIWLGNDVGWKTMHLLNSTWDSLPFQRAN